MQTGKMDEMLHRMVNTQIKSRGITDEKVIEAMLNVKRHLFVSPEQQDEAYDDHPLAIGYSQTISQPYMVAIMSEKLRVEKTMTVLEIGSGSGYQTGILGYLAAKVYSIERVAELTTMAWSNLRKAMINNVELKTADGTQGWPEYAPFDRVIVTAAGRRIPKPLVDQLKPGGVMVIPVGDGMMQTLNRIEKTLDSSTPEGYRLNVEKLNHCVFVPLIGEHA